MVGEVKKINFFCHYDNDSVDDILKNEEINCGANKNISLRNHLNKELFGTRTSGFRLIRLSENNNVKESAPLLDLDFGKILEIPWTETELYQLFQNPFYFMIVKEEKDVTQFMGLCKWHLSENEIEAYIRPFWNSLCNIIRDGIKLTKSSRGISNNLPSQSEHPILHVRPKARNADDKTQLPDGQYITKQGIWLNSGWLKEIAEIFVVGSNEYNQFLKDEETPLIIQEELSHRELVELVAKPILTSEEKDKIFMNSKEKRIIYRFNQKFVKRGSFYLDRNFPSLESYYVETIKKLSYFDKSDFYMYDTQTFDRVIRELNASYSILKIDEERYITSLQLFKANITKNDLYDFIDEIFDFLNENNIEVFTFRYLITRGFNNELLDLGFNDKFYINLLENTPNISTKIIYGQVLFSIKEKDFLFHNLICSQLESTGTSSGGRIFGILENEYKIKFDSYSQFIQAFKREESELYYAEKMNYFFRNYQLYLEEVNKIDEY